MTIRISILTSHTPLSRGFNDFYPLIRWLNEFQKQGILINFFSKVDQKKLEECDIVIIDYRFFQDRILGVGYLDETYIIDIIGSLKNKGLRVILFDSSDSTGSQCFGVTPYVDIHLKKQLLRSRIEHTIDRGDKSTMCWIQDNYTPSNIPYKPCRSEDLPKLRLGWNIGMVDYRKYPMQRFYPIGTSVLLNQWYKLPDFSKTGYRKDLFTSYRGSIHSDSRYSFQRSHVQKTLKRLEVKYPLRCGKPISKKNYLKELNRSKVVISPYGWGEICYRDFECFINGAVLVKPNMSHLETFPDYFVENETYRPVAWDMHNLDDILVETFEHYDDFLHIAIAGQKRFRDSITDVDHFIKHFKENIF